MQPCSNSIDMRQCKYINKICVSMILYLSWISVEKNTCREPKTFQPHLRGFSKCSSFHPQFSSDTARFWSSSRGDKVAGQMWSEWVPSGRLLTLRPCQGKLPRRKYMNMWPRASRSSRLLCSETVTHTHTQKKSETQKNYSGASTVNSEKTRTGTGDAQEPAC